MEHWIPVLFSPQGTRWIADRLPFRKAAFVVAQSHTVPLDVPIPLRD